MLYLTNINVNTPLTQFYGFCKVIVAERACPDIYRFDISWTCRDDPNSTAFNVVKCYSLLFRICAYPFDAIFGWYLSMLELFIICKLSSRCHVTNHAKDWVSCSYFDDHVTFNVMMSFHLVALIFFTFHHMSLIFSKQFLKEILSKHHVTTQKLYFHLLHIFISSVY